MNSGKPGVSGRSKQYPAGKVLFPAGLLESAQRKSITPVKSVVKLRVFTVLKYGV